MKKILIIILFYIFCILTNFKIALSNEKVNSEVYSRYDVNNKIGFIYNTMTYPGIMYQRYLSDDWRIAGSAFYLSEKNNDENNSNYFINFGLQVHRILYHSNDVNFSLNAGYGYRYENYKYQQIIDFEIENFVNNYHNNNLALGFGTSYTPFKNLTLDFDFGYVFSIESINSVNESEQLNEVSHANTYFVEIGVGIGIFIAF